MSMVPFIVCISTSILFFVMSNIYLVMKQFSINKMIRESGQLVSSYPVIILQNVSVEGPHRPDIVSPDAVRPPPSYHETMQAGCPTSSPPPSYS